MTKDHGRAVAGFSGIWYSNQPQADRYGFKYSGGLATYPQQVMPIAVHAPEVNRTFFTFGGANGRGELDNLIAYMDHNTGSVSRPRLVLGRRTRDAHYNATLALDAWGYVHVFCNAHGIGGEQPKDDATYGRSYVFRGTTPYSIDDFEPVYEGNFSYSQVWPRADGSLLWLHTRYSDESMSERRLYWATMREGEIEGPPRELACLGVGDYQVSAAAGDTVWTAFDFHPHEGGLNARTNIYLAQYHADSGWRDAHGKPLSLPLTDVDNPALVRDYATAGRLVYLKDLAFDDAGEPHVLYLLSSDPWSGPQVPARSWHVLFRRDGEWVDRQIAESSHNYDHGFLDIDRDGVWRVLAPLGPGPQPDGTGGQVVLLESADSGLSWTTIRRYPLFDERNQTYVRQVVGGTEEFWALWADGDAYRESDSTLYLADRAGEMYRLPRSMHGDTARPERIRQG